jgi:hypothetical protein
VVELRAERAAHLQHMARALPPGARALRARRTRAADRIYSALPMRTRGTSTIRLYRGTHRLAVLSSVAELGDRIEGDLHLWIAEHAPGLIFVHAGAVSWRGLGVVIPGRSMSGKSTLVRALIARGATYYSDEYAILDADGKLHPYARRLSLRRKTRRPRRVAARALGAATGKRAVEIRLIVITRYRADVTFVPRPLSPGRALLSLLKNTVAARARTEEALDHLMRATRHARIVSGRRGAADDCAAALLDELSRETPRRQDAKARHKDRF